MTQRRVFDRDYLKQEFDKLTAKTTQPLTLFLIGGGAMAIYGLLVLVSAKKNWKKENTH